MLISLSYKFVFVATLKTASSAIEEALSPISEIRLPVTGWGKHDSLSAIEKRFAWVFDIIPRDNFVVFGVLRDPVSFLVSLYNSHTRKEFASRPKLYTGSMSFTEFVNSWIWNNKDQAGPQSKRFIDASGQYGINYIARYNNLERDLGEISSRIGIPTPRLSRANVSPIGLNSSQIERDNVDFIRSHYNMDYAVIEQLAGRWLRPHERLAGEGDVMQQFGTQQKKAKAEVRCDGDPSSIA